MCQRILVLLIFLSSSLAAQTGTFQNPILAGNYADPSILRDGEDYYMVHSSFHYYPGLLIWHSKDLVHWKPVTHALYQYVGAVWAPEIVKHKGKYYIYFPANNTVYVVTADAIAGPWSKPTDLKIPYIDPGHITDDKGQRYLYFNAGYCIPLSEDGLATTGPAKKLYDGWKIPREWRIECFCLEGPKLLKRGKYYYLVVAEGGTAGPATSHMVVAARSVSPLGPWENSPYNPIVRTQSKEEKWWSKGHGTLVDDIKGNWWLVYHGYEKGYYNMGRQTLLEPVEWTADGWFRVPEKIRADLPMAMPAGKTDTETYYLSDDFEGGKVRPQWQFFNEYDTSRIRQEKGVLILKAKGNSLATCNPLTCMPQDHSYEVEAEIETDGAIAALALFYNDRMYSGIAADSATYYGILKGWQFSSDKNTTGNRFFLRMVNEEHVVDMYYSGDGKKWTKFESSFDISSMNHNAAGDFLSIRIAIGAMGQGSIKVRDFKYKGK